MSHPIPEDAQRLATRLRQLADELESAARYGVPLPYMVSVSGHQYGNASFSATGEEFDAWADYTEATVEKYDHNGRHWVRATADVNGLPLEFSCVAAPAEVSA
jgi:hypothetical protein